MMVWISPLLAVISLVTVPLSLVVTVLIARRAQPQFAAAVALDRPAQRPRRGDVLRPRHRQGLRSAGSRREATFDEANEQVYRASFRAQFISGIVMPAMTFVGNLGYVGDRGRRRAAGRVRADLARRRPGVHPVLAAVHDADHAARRGWRTSSSPGWRPPSASSRCSTRPRRSRTRRSRSGSPRGPRPRGIRARVVPVRPGQAADRGPLAGRRAGADGRHRRPDGRGQDHARQPAHAVLRDRRRADHARRRRHPRPDPRRPAALLRHGAPGRVAVRRHDPRQHRLRRRRRDRGGDRAPRPRPRTSTTSCGPCRTATTPSSRTTPRTSPPARGS